MKISNKLKLRDLSFKVFMVDLNGSHHYDIFGSYRVLESIAMYVLWSPEERKKHIHSSPLRWCFGDLDGNANYEFMMNAWPYGNDDKISDGEKVSLYRLCVEPNEEFLMDLVARVSKTSARQFLREERRRYK